MRCHRPSPRLRRLPVLLTGAVLAWAAPAQGLAAEPVVAVTTRRPHAEEFQKLHRAMESKLLAMYARCRVDIDGKKLLRPCVSPYYNGIWHDDFTWPHQASDQLARSPVLGDTLAWLTGPMLAQPVVADRVEFDGVAVMSPGPRGKPMSEAMTLHLPSAWTRLLSHAEQNGVTIPRKKEWARLIAASYERVPRAPESALVHTAPGRRVVAFGFQDSICFTGEILTTSLVTKRGLERAADLFARDLPAETTAAWRQRAAAIGQDLPRLFDAQLGGFVGATGDGRAFDMWGNGLAWPYATPEQKAIIAKTVKANAATLFNRGCTRQLPGTGGWPGTKAAIGYQNGGHWAAGTGFVLPMLVDIDPDLALRVARDLVNDIDGYRGAEWIDTDGKPHGPADFLASYAMATLGLRAVVEGKPVLDYF